jgi:flavin reductase (DIM6/NTAB) family NADH-FMN oxidoreductase RutF
MTASSFCSVSLEPPLVLVCVNRRTLTHALIPEQGSFAIHVLRDDLEDVSDRCAGFLGEEAHWLNDLPYRTERTGAPVLDGVLCWLDCSLWQAYDGGDHTIFVGEVQAAGKAPGAPLLWFHRGYRLLAEE